MYVKPGHIVTDYQAPREKGRKLRTIPRPGQPVEMRITLERYAQYASVQLRLWGLDEKGEWRRKGEGINVYSSEIESLIASLQEALYLLRLEGFQEPTPKPPNPRLSRAVKEAVERSRAAEDSSEHDSEESVDGDQ